MNVKQAPPSQIQLSSDDSDEFTQFNDPPVLDSTVMLQIDPKILKGDSSAGEGPSKQKGLSKHGHSKSKISNSELMFAMRSIDARLKKLEDTISDIGRMMHIMQQSNPTFLSAGRSGRLIKTDSNGRNTVIQDPV